MLLILDRSPLLIRLCHVSSLSTCYTIPPSVALNARLIEVGRGTSAMGAAIEGRSRDIPGRAALSTVGTLRSWADDLLSVLCSVMGL